MRNKLYVIAVVLSLIVSLVLPSIGLAGPSRQNLPAPIRLKATTFVPTRGETPALSANLRVDDYAAGQRGYYLVQFRAPVQPAWKDQLAALGADVLDYVPDFAFKVRMTPAQALQAQSLGSVGWVGLFHPAYKLSPALARDGAAHAYRVRIERGADAALAATAIAASGATVLGREGGDLLIAADAAQLDRVAQVLDVAWVENYVLNEKHNEFGGGVIVGANTAHARGYDGSTQIAAVSDTGLGDGTAAGAHPDIPASRIVSIFNWPGVTDSCFTQIINDGARDVDSGHGTHTSASVLSDGGPGGEGKGVAPAARLVFQATENWAVPSALCQALFGYTPGYYLIGLPADLRPHFQQAYDAGARIHSNSWGAAVAGDYNANSAETDDFVWNHRDMIITFSAGNEGTDANANGVVDNDSIGSPATAKNVLTIGASENDRQGNWQCDTSLTYTSYDAYQTGQTCNSMGGNQAGFLGTWGQRYPADFPAAPLANDVTAGNPQQMASWSSRGPTDDTRIKPDVVAPGTWVLSGFSSLYQEGYGDPVNPQNNIYQWDGWGMPRNGQYKYMGGTSMSNPIAAGAATVVRDYYQKAYTHAASAALVKATLINSAVDLLDENNDGANDNDFPIPNVHEGWGRLNLANATDETAEFVDNTSGLITSGTATFAYDVTPGGSPFKVSLVWSDFPSTESASVNLVNDLDLTVTAPGGATVYRGNVFSGGWSATGGSADRRNNVENVYVQSAAAGTWTVEVRGFNVPNGPQPFALVVDGGTATTPPPTPTPSPTPTIANTGLLSPGTNAAQTGGDGNGFQTNPNNGHANDSVFAVDTNSGTNNNTSCTNNGKDKHRYYNYNVSLPGGASIRGIEVRLDARVDSTANAPRMCVQLSWNGGTTWTTAKTTANLTTSEATYTLGNATDTWGRTWGAGEFSNANFRVRIINIASSTARDFSLDWVAVRVTYQ
ncbi:MAG TPA: S8 family serine peptidase [Anaerolineae bacterium]|nr:S8 family serine peptidase [Anaerolineae bacterium]